MHVISFSILLDGDKVGSIEGKEGLNRRGQVQSDTGTVWKYSHLITEGKPLLKFRAPLSTGELGPGTRAGEQ